MKETCKGKLKGIHQQTCQAKAGKSKSLLISLSKGKNPSFHSPPRWKFKTPFQGQTWHQVIRGVWSIVPRSITSTMVPRRASPWLVKLDHSFLLPEVPWSLSLCLHRGEMIVIFHLPPPHLQPNTGAKTFPQNPPPTHMNTRAVPWQFPQYQRFKVSSTCELFPTSRLLEDHSQFSISKVQNIGLIQQSLHQSLDHVFAQKGPIKRKGPRSWSTRSWWVLGYSISWGQRRDVNSLESSAS